MVLLVRSTRGGEDAKSGSVYSSFRDGSRTLTCVLECPNSLLRKINGEDHLCGLVVVPLKLTFFDLI